MATLREILEARNEIALEGPINMEKLEKILAAKRQEEREKKKTTKEAVDMPAQHKRPGRKAKEERIKRAREREAAKKIKVLVRRPRYEERYDGISPGRLVIYAEVKHGA